MIEALLNIDRDIFLAAQHLIPPQYATPLKILAESIVMLGALILISIWIRGTLRKDDTQKKVALRIFCTIAGTFLIYSIINLGMPTWREGAMQLSGASALIPHPTDNSFPSGHALFSAALLVGLWRYFRHGWLITITIITALITATARVLGGVHYPGDILGGFILGGIGAWMLHWVITSSFFETKIYPLWLRIGRWFHL